jgi:hypothetical protein
MQVDEDEDEDEDEDHHDEDEILHHMIIMIFSSMEPPEA